MRLSQKWERRPKNQREGEVLREVATAIKEIRRKWVDQLNRKKRAVGLRTGLNKLLDAQKTVLSDSERIFLEKESRRLKVDWEDMPEDSRSDVVLGRVENAMASRLALETPIEQERGRDPLQEMGKRGRRTQDERTKSYRGYQVQASKFRQAVLRDVGAWH